MKKTLLIVFTFFCSLSYGQTTTDAENYISRYYRFAKKEMKREGIPVSITLAQGLLESNYGKSVLAVKARNHFGIKCTSDWHGKKYHYDDDKPNECFRKYRSVKKSYRDHSLFLHRERYKDLFKLDITDYKGWAYGLKKAGYATNPNYPQLLIKLIEKYDLHRFDKRRFSKKEINTPQTPPDTDKYYTVQKGDTLYSLSKKWNVSLVKLKELNNLSSDTISVGQKIVLPQ